MKDQTTDWRTSLREMRPTWPDSIINSIASEEEADYYIEHELEYRTYEVNNERIEALIIPQPYRDYKTNMEFAIFRSVEKSGEILSIEGFQWLARVRRIGGVRGNLLAEYPDRPPFIKGRIDRQIPYNDYIRLRIDEIKKELPSDCWREVLKQYARWDESITARLESPLEAHIYLRNQLTDVIINGAHALIQTRVTLHDFKFTYRKDKEIQFPSPMGYQLYSIGGGMQQPFAEICDADIRDLREHRKQKVDTSSYLDNHTLNFSKLGEALNTGSLEQQNEGHWKERIEDITKAWNIITHNADQPLSPLEEYVINKTLELEQGRKGENGSLRIKLIPWYIYCHDLCKKIDNTYNDFRNLGLTCTKSSYYDTMGNGEQIYKSNRYKKLYDKIKREMEDIVGRNK